MIIDDLSWYVNVTQILVTAYKFKWQLKVFLNHLTRLTMMFSLVFNKDIAG